MPVGHSAHSTVADIAVKSQPDTLPSSGSTKRVNARAPLDEK